MADQFLMENPMTTAEDLIVGGASGAPARIAAGSEGDVLSIVSGAVAWAAAPGSGSIAYASADLASPQTLVASTVADITGCSVSLAAGTWLILARCIGKAGSGSGYFTMQLADGSNNYVQGKRGYLGGTTTTQFVSLALQAIVTPGSTTTYKLRAQGSHNHTIEVSDSVLAGAGATGIIAIQLA